MVSDWMHEDAESQTVLMSVLSRGAAILERDKAIAATSIINSDSWTRPNIIAANVLFNMSQILQQNASQPTSAKKNRQTAAPKLFQKMPNPRSSNLPPPPNPLVSTGSKDLGLGLPTFALLASEITIKGVADNCLNLVCNHLTHMSPRISSNGAIKISSKWDDIKASMDILKAQENARLALPEEQRMAYKSISVPSIRYFAIEKRIIVGISERPAWLEDRNNAHHQGPRVAITIRDPSGKYSWHAKYTYKDDLLRKLDAIGSTATSNADLSVNRLAEKLFTAVENQQFDALPFTVPAYCKVYQPHSTNDINLPSIEELIKGSLDISPFSGTHQLENSWTASKHALDESTYITPLAAREIQTTDPIPKHFRLFLAEMGFLDINNEQIQALDSSDALFQELRALDRLSEYILTYLGEILYPQAYYIATKEPQVC